MKTDFVLESTAEKFNSWISSYEVSREELDEIKKGQVKDHQELLKQFTKSETFKDTVQQTNLANVLAFATAKDPILEFQLIVANSICAGIQMGLRYAQALAEQAELKELEKL